MGVDIHDYAEKRTAEGWLKVGPVFPTRDRPIWARSPRDRVPNEVNIWAYPIYPAAGEGDTGNEDPADVGIESDCTDHPFDGLRFYGLFGFLADVMNRSQCPVIAPPRGLPADVSPEVLQAWENWCEDFDGFGPSWVTVEELLRFDYDQVFEDQRTGISLHLTDAEPIIRSREKRLISMREFLGESNFFEMLTILESLGDPADVRIVFWFDA